MKVLLIATTVSFLSGLMPAFAAHSCQDWCLRNRCAHGAANQTLCMNRCVPACRQHQHPRHK
jgi:hypothetical protein